MSNPRYYIDTNHGTAQRFPTFGSLLDRFLAWQDHMRGRQALLALDDRMLRDLGLSRADVEGLVAKPFWRI